MPSELDRILNTYSRVEEIQRLFCIDNIEWSDELPYYLRDIRTPRNNLYPGALRNVYKLEGKIGVIDLRTQSESSCYRLTNNLGEGSLSFFFPAWVYST